MSSFSDGMAAIFTQVFGEDDLLPYTHAAVTTTIRGIFENPAMAVEGMAEAALIECDAWVAFDASDLPSGYGEGDTVVIRGATYRTKVPMPDGRGMVRIPLLKV